MALMELVYGATSVAWSDDRCRAECGAAVAVEQRALVGLDDHTGG
jgi:hypothetical protein